MVATSDRALCNSAGDGPTQDQRDSAVSGLKKWAFEYGPLPDSETVKALSVWVDSHGDDFEAMYWCARGIETGCGSENAWIKHSQSKVIDLLEKAASGKFAPAQATLAIKYLLGDGVNRDLSQAKELLRESLRDDDPIAHNAMVIYIISEKQFDGDQAERAMAHAELAVKGGYLRAQYFIATLKLQLNEVDAAVRELKRLATAGEARAQLLLSKCYQEGKYVDRDENAAFSFATQAVKDGNRDAYFNLANCFSRGLGTQVDPSKAFTCYEKAATCGMTAAKVEAAKLCLTGTGTKVDFERGRGWMFQAADEGSGEAMFNIGRGYIEGLWLDRDLNKAHIFLERSSKMGIVGSDIYLKMLDYHRDQDMESQKSVKTDKPGNSKSK